MRPNEHLHALVKDETKLEGKELQDIATTILAGIIRGGVIPSEICLFVAQQIRRLCRKKQITDATNIFQRIRDRIAIETLQSSFQEEKNRRSAEKMRQEILEVYKVIKNNGKGVVYLGSARTKPGDPYFEAARELGREVSLLLQSTAWSGAGPGQMEAPLRGAKEVGGRVAGVKILLEHESSSFEQEVNDVLEPENVAICRFFGPRKIGLADAAMRDKEADRTAIITTPGGFGTRDEFYEYLVLKQLKKLGTNFPVPIILLNQNGFFSRMLDDIGSLLSEGMIRQDDLKLFSVCPDNRCVLDALANFYGIPENERGYLQRTLEF